MGERILYSHYSGTLSRSRIRSLNFFAYLTRMVNVRNVGLCSSVLVTSVKLNVYKKFIGTKKTY